MNIITRVLLFIALMAGAGAFAADDYPAVVPGYRLEFPRDEGSHPQFRTEWWYITGWLEDESGAPLGFQVTFFRTRPGIGAGNPSRFAPQQLLFAHVAISDPRVGKLLRGERSARAGFGLAEARTGTLDVTLDDWSLRRSSPEGVAKYDVAIESEALAMQLNFVATQPPLLQGAQGFSQKSVDSRNASYYYSLPHLRTTGQVRIGKRQYKVRGSAWLDHEWSSAILETRAQGWDWVGLNLDDGGALMASRIRDPEGKSLWALATQRAAQSEAARPFAPDEIEWTALAHWRSPRTGIQYPVEWKVRVGDRTFILRPLIEDQESDARGSTGTIYWEGAVRAYDESGKSVGRGYLELTGYGARLRF